jgi:fructokinase
MLKNITELSDTLSGPAPQPVVTYGEALVDMIEMPDGRFAAALGGSVCNFTVAAARQGLPVSYLNPLSEDSFGAGFAALLGTAGVTLASPRRSPCPTALALVTLDAHGTPSYVFHRQQVADRDILPYQAAASMPARPGLFHTGGLALLPDELESTLAVLRAAAAAGALVSIDANMRPLACPDLPAYVAGVRRALAHADLIKVSEEDLHHLGYGYQDPFDAALDLFQHLDVKLVALTLGAAGAVLLSRKACATVRPPPGIAVADTVGCGDCFMAGLVAWLSRARLLRADGLADAGVDLLDQAARFAVATASLNAMRAGCQPPSAAEVAVFLTGAAVPPVPCAVQ